MYIIEIELENDIDEKEASELLEQFRIIPEVYNAEMTKDD